MAVVGEGGFSDFRRADFRWGGGAVGRCGLRVEADLGFGLDGWRTQKGLQFAPDEAQCLVVMEQAGIDLGESFEDIGVSEDELALQDEGTDDKNAHLDGGGAV